MNPSKVSANRYALLDELRGLDLISMMCYHGLWDVVFLFGVQLPWYTGMPGHLWQQSICWVFILLSGFCLPMGHHPYKRGALVFGAGALVTAVTVLFMPEDVVLFGCSRCWARPWGSPRCWKRHCVKFRLPWALWSALRCSG